MWGATSGMYFYPYAAIAAGYFFMKGSMNKEVMRHKTYKAFLFDLNGTMIDDMSYHIKAWHRILNGLGSDISIERTREECYGKNHELLERIFPGRFNEEEKDRMSLEKEKQYQEEFRPHLQLIRGLDGFLEDAKNKGIQMAIGSAAIMFNIDFVLDGLNIRHYITAIVSADDVKESKPHPETFLNCAGKLNVQPGDCLVFEDAPKGVEAARNAGMDCLVITTMHERQEFEQYKNIIGFIRNFEDPVLRQLL
jgi:beta-phosphoglucomutase family hydrolase